MNKFFNEGLVTDYFGIENSDQIKSDRVNGYDILQIGGDAVFIHGGVVVAFHAVSGRRIPRLLSHGRKVNKTVNRWRHREIVPLPTGICLPCDPQPPLP